VLEDKIITNNRIIGRPVSNLIGALFSAASGSSAGWPNDMKLSLKGYPDPRDQKHHALGHDELSPQMSGQEL